MPNNIPYRACQSILLVPRTSAIVDNYFSFTFPHELTAHYRRIDRSRMGHRVSGEELAEIKYQALISYFDPWKEGSRSWLPIARSLFNYRSERKAPRHNALIEQGLITEAQILSDIHSMLAVSLMADSALVQKRGYEALSNFEDALQRAEILRDKEVDQLNSISHDLDKLTLELARVSKALRRMTEKPLSRDAILEVIYSN